MSRAAWLALVCVALAYGLALATPLSIVDDSGAQVTLTAPARRLISLSPHLTELVFDVGAGDRLVGVDSASDYPSQSRSLPRVGSAAGIDLERVIALHPDLILAWLSGNKPADVARLRALSMPMFLSEPRRLDDVPRTLRAIGTLLKSEAQAQKQAVAFEQRLQTIRAQYSGRRPLSAFVEIWHQPLMTVNGTHLVSDVLRACGARNVFTDLQTLAGPVGLEELLAADPDVIVSATGFEEDAATWQRLRAMQAVKKSRVLKLDPDLLTRATPRILDAVRQLCIGLDRARE